MSPRDYSKEYRKEMESVSFIRVRAPRETKERLQKKVAEDGTTVSQWILNRIAEYLEEPPK